MSLPSLVRYDAACRAVAEAKTVDEAKDIRDKAIAMQAYARQAKNKDLEADALEIRMRATRRIGAMMEEQKKTVGLASGREGKRKSLGLPENPSDRPTLSQGIDKSLAHSARKLAALSEEAFERTVDDGRSALSDVVRNAMRADAGEARRATRTARLSDAPLPSGHRYAVILADPPWKFDLHGSDYDRGAEQHYPVMETEDIRALPVADITAPDTVLFMWTTSPHLPDAMRVVDAWGFEYVTCAVWVKDKPGLGHWVRNQHELLLIARRGMARTPLPANRPPSVIAAPRREHSRKPDEVYAVIERMFPELPRVELFARARRSGWDAWGKETEKFDATGEAEAIKKRRVS
jgi:N6-adenosine-specific RNA methylase IME4